HPLTCVILWPMQFRCTLRRFAYHRGATRSKERLMADTGIATAADYSEALGVSRRAKSVLALLLLLMLIAQVTTFLLIRYDILHIDTTADEISVNVSAHPAMAAPTTTVSVDRLRDVMHYITGLTVLGGITLAIVLAA